MVGLPAPDSFDRRLAEADALLGRVAAFGAMVTKQAQSMDSGGEQPG